MSIKSRFLLYLAILPLLNILLINTSVLPFSLPDFGVGLLVSFTFALAARSVFTQPLSNKAMFVLCLLTTVAIFYSTKLYFYWDEWHALERFMKSGISAVFIAHNEHFLPVFFGLYYLESLVFGAWYEGYLLASYLIHAANAVLLRSVLTQLLPSVDRRVATALSFLWLISSLHSEVLHWAFTAAVSLGALAVLICLHYSISFLQSGEKKAGVLAAIFAALAPLCFGNGFAVLGYVFFVAVLLIALTPNPRIKICKRSAILLAAQLTLLALVAICYWYFRDGGGHNFQSEKLSHSFLELLQTVVVGWGLGATLRGLALYPDLSATISAAYLPDRLLHIAPAELIFSYFAIALLSIFALLLWGKRQLLGVFLLGNAIVITSYVLPALGRSQFGLSSGLYLRYTYIALVGLLIALTPILVHLWQLMSSRPMWRNAILSSCFVAYVFAHLLMTSRFEYFREQGQKNQVFVAALVQWQESLCEVGSSINKSYEGKKTPLSGKFPAMPPTITPGRHPVEIYKVLLWLNPELLDFKCKKPQ